MTSASAPVSFSSEVTGRRAGPKNAAQAAHLELCQAIELVSSSVSRIAVIEEKVDELLVAFKMAFATESPFFAPTPSPSEVDESDKFRDAGFPVCIDNDSELHEKSYALTDVTDVSVCPIARATVVAAYDHAQQEIFEVISDEESPEKQFPFEEQQQFQEPQELAFLDDLPRQLFSVNEGDVADETSSDSPSDRSEVALHDDSSDVEGVSTHELGDIPEGAASESEVTPDARPTTVETGGLMQRSRLFTAPPSALCEPTAAKIKDPCEKARSELIADHNKSLAPAELGWTPTGGGSAPEDYSQMSPRELKAKFAQQMALLPRTDEFDRMRELLQGTGYV